MLNDTPDFIAALRESAAAARALQGALRGIVSQLTRGIGSAAGGGLGGGILAALARGGLSALLARLLRGGDSLRASGPLPLPPLLNFPQLLLPGYASSPASALYGQRPVPQGAGVHVTVEYKRGADDFVVAKVAQRLAELNHVEGIG
jgi:hypothetical protein